MDNIHKLERYLQKIQEISDHMKIRDIFRNKKFIEVLAAHKLGHEVNTHPGGCDAWELINGRMVQLV